MNTLKVTFILLALLFSVNGYTQTDWQTNIPNVQSFSSPRCADLNGDNVLDVVIGAGLENQTSNRGVIAINGSNGSILWFEEFDDQIFGSALFQDINQDNTPDVFIGGRGGEFRAIDGDLGETIWAFYNGPDSIPAADAGVYQFYTPQFIPDQNGDGLKDLLCANGGDPTALLPGDERPAGRLMIVSAATGELLAAADVPDGEETYMSPLVHDFFGNGNLEVIFGTGGELNTGSLWRVSLEELMAGDISRAQELVNGGSKGFIAPPSIADLNRDNINDIVVSSYDGRVIAINGIDNNIMWENQIPMGETNASPAIGYFNGDEVPDVFASFGIGLAPTYIEFTQLMIDGATGNIEWQDSLGLFQFASPVAVDSDEDGFDEVIFMTNSQAAGNFLFFHQIHNIDFNDNETTLYDIEIGGANINATPWIGNLDNDGQMDMVYTFQRDSTSFVNENGTSVRKYDLDFSDDGDISWGGYLGTDYTAAFDNKRSNCADVEEYIVGIDKANMGMECTVSIGASSSGCLTGDCTYLWSNGEVEPVTTLAANGRQYVTITHPDGCTRVSIIDFKEISAVAEIDSVQCFGDDNGRVFIDFEGGTPPYSTTWNGLMSGGVTSTSLFIQSELTGGTYDFMVQDALGCTYQQVFELPETPIFEISSQVTEDSLENDGDVDFIVNGGVGEVVVTLNGEVVETPIINLAAGQYELLATDANGCTAPNLVIVKDFSSLQSIQESSIFEVNMDQANLVLLTNKLQPSSVKYRIYCSNSQLLNSGTLNIGAPTLINTAQWPIGMYFVQILSDGQTYFAKVPKL